MILVGSAHALSIVATPVVSMTCTQSSRCDAVRSTHFEFEQFLKVGEGLARH